MLVKNKFVVKRILTIAIAYAESNGGNNSGTYYGFTYCIRCNIKEICCYTLVLWEDGLSRARREMSMLTHFPGE